MTVEVAAMNSCFAVLAWHISVRPLYNKHHIQGPPPTVVSLMQSFKHQLHTRHVGTVGWEPLGSSTTKCTGKGSNEH